MKRRVVGWLLALSLAVNALVAIPAVVLLLTSSGIQTVIYQQILAPRFGKPEIVFIGDSLTEDGGVWAFRIGRYGLDTWNLAQGGLTTQQIGEGQARRAAELKPRYAFLMAGINDGDKTASGVAESFAHYRDMLELLRRAGVEPIVQLTLYRRDEPAPDFVDGLNTRLADYARQNGLVVVDLNPALSRDRSLLPQYSRDGTHLTEAAYEVWAAEVRRVLAAR